MFDQNNQFVDLGIWGGASGDFAGGLFGAEFGYEFSVNNGFKSEWIEKCEKASDFMTK